MREIIKYRWCQTLTAVIIIACSITVIYLYNLITHSVDKFSIVTNIIFLLGCIFLETWFVKIFISSFLD